ncbi:MAG: hypothetical protein JWQ51_3411 [Tardiphaga sp.]|nr:hypothetical protein [Tardiphaga sp.]
MEWNPISTVPPGDDPLFLLLIDGKHVTVGSWNDGCFRDCLFEGSFNPTHWMTLPTPPQS